MHFNNLLFDWRFLSISRSLDSTNNLVEFCFKKHFLNRYKTWQAFCYSHLYPFDQRFLVKFASHDFIRQITVKIFSQKWGIESQFRLILLIPFSITLSTGLKMPPFYRVRVLTETAN